MTATDEVTAALALASVSLGASDIGEAREFYASAMRPAETEEGDAVALDLHGTARVRLASSSALAAEAGVPVTTVGFRGYVLTYILGRPAEVRTVMELAASAGAATVKPARKALFGSFSGALRAPDGSIWKLASSTNADTGRAAAGPRPSETTLILGVADPVASKRFYEALGLTTDRDYGRKYLDFHPAAGAPRLCLMERAVLAKDTGVDPEGSGFSRMVLTARVASPEAVDAALAAAVAAGGRITVAGAQADRGYVGHFADPDGFVWAVVAG
ncbi:VOC family protein [Agromyces silvae]|uniref:VOC family protein n=1 Tax=Agromyces silvae TaxID=3388266 RepID=UPI00280B450D|nr:VOC family protein [Agromyces protaetiae]